MISNDFSVERPDEFLILMYQGRPAAKVDRFSGFRSYSGLYNCLSRHEVEAAY